MSLFEPTKKSVGEIKKARNKNYNMKILNFMYTGSRDSNLKCCVSGSSAFRKVPCFVTGEVKNRFNIDFNHIRQFQDGGCRSGISLDKGNYDPSARFRSKYLDNHKMDLIEFMTIMPVSQEVHSYISQDSAKGHITLSNFNKDHWPWHLQNASNFNGFCKTYGLEFLKYSEFIDHLKDITAPPIRDRIEGRVYWEGNLLKSEHWFV